MLYESKEVRDAVVSSGMEHGAAESYDKLAELLAAVAHEDVDSDAKDHAVPLVRRPRRRGGAFLRLRVQELAVLTINGEDPASAQDKVSSARVRLDGQELILFNGGPHFTFSEAISLFVNCETQHEIDELWEKLSEGGETSRCGWLKDKFGVSWQIVPTALGEMLSDPDDEKSERAMDAMLGMTKLDIAGLRRAFDGG